MITPSPEAIAADARLAVHSPSFIRRGTTTDGFEWVAVYTGARAAFRCQGFVRRELLSWEEVDSIVNVASQGTTWDLVEVVKAVAP